MSSKKVMMTTQVAPGANNNLNRFAGEGEKGLKISPDQTLQISVVFIAAVFLLHLLGKLVGFGSAPAQQAPEAEPQEVQVD